MVPDREIGLQEGRLGRAMDLPHRWSRARHVADGRVVPIEVLSATDARAESNIPPDGQPGRAADGSPEPVAPSLEPLASSRSPDANAAGSEAVARPAAQPLATDSGSRQEGSRRQEWCAIVFAGAKRQGEFRVVVLDNGGQRRVVASSSSFGASRSGRVSHRGSAKEAHDLLVKRLLALGWRPVASRGRWHDTGFARTAPSGDRPVERLLIICRHDRLAARFQAARFDELDDATIVAESAPFRALHIRGSMKLARRAAKVHNALLERLQADGWQTTGGTGGEWYAHVLEKPAGLPFRAITERESAASRCVDSA